MPGSRSKLHPILLVGVFSLMASTLLEWLLLPDFPGDLLQGFLDGLAVVTIFVHLVACRAGRLRRL